MLLSRGGERRINAYLPPYLPLLSSFLLLLSLGMFPNKPRFPLLHKLLYLIIMLVADFIRLVLKPVVRFFLRPLTRTRLFIYLDKNFTVEACEALTHRLFPHFAKFFVEPCYILHVRWLLAMCFTINVTAIWVSLNKAKYDPFLLEARNLDFYPLHFTNFGLATIQLFFYIFLIYLVITRILLR